MAVLVCGAAILGIAAVPAINDRANVTLVWDHPADSPSGNSNRLYRIYQSTDGTNWMAITNVSGLSNSVVLQVQKAEAWYYATTVDPTNFWAESLPSNAAQTPAPPLGGENLRISRGPK